MQAPRLVAELLLAALDRLAAAAPGSSARKAENAEPLGEALPRPRRVGAVADGVAGDGAEVLVRAAAARGADDPEALGHQARRGRGGRGRAGACGGRGRPTRRRGRWCGRPGRRRRRSGTRAKPRHRPPEGPFPAVRYGHGCPERSRTWRPSPTRCRRRPTTAAGSTTGIVHFGVGGFHRAHQAMYHDRLMNEGKALDWGICGVGVMPGDRRMKDALDAQDGLYTLVVKHGDGTYEPRVIGSITRVPVRARRPRGGDREDGGRRRRGSSRSRSPRAATTSTPSPASSTPTTPTSRTTSSPARRRGRRSASITEALRAPPRARARAVHGHVVRQPPGQRPPRAAGVHGLRPAARPRARRLGRARGALPQLHGRPHHARRPPTTTARRCASASASRTAGRSSASRSPSGCSRTPSPPGARRTRTPACRSSRTSSRTS